MAFQKEIIISQCVLDGKGALCCFWGKTCGKIYYTWKGEWLLKIPGFCDELFTRMTANSSSYHYIPLPLLLARDEVYEEEMKSMKEVFWNCDLLWSTEWNICEAVGLLGLGLQGLEVFASTGSQVSCKEAWVIQLRDCMERERLWKMRVDVKEKLSSPCDRQHQLPDMGVRPSWILHSWMSLPSWHHMEQRWAILLSLAWIAAPKNQKQ